MSRESELSRQEVEEIIRENEGVLLEKVAEFSQQNSVRILCNCKLIFQYSYYTLVGAEFEVEK